MGEGGEGCDEEGTTVHAWGMIYNLVMNYVLLYNIKSLVLKVGMPKVLEGLHHQIARSITWMTAHHTTRG